MKKAISIISAIMCMAVLFASCTSPSSGSKKISMYDLSEAMKGATAFAESQRVSSEDDDADEKLGYVSDMEPEKLESWFDIYASDGNESTDEIAVLKVKDEADAQEAANTLQDHIDYRISLYSTYGADKVPSLEKAEIFVYEDYAVLIVAQDSNAVKEAFMNFVG